MNTNDMCEIDFEMSNFDMEIPNGFADALISKPREVFGTHSGWNFNGKVYFSEGQFHEEVWVYGTPVATIASDTLQDLMISVCERYGYE